LPAALVPIVQAAGWSVLALLLSLISCIALWSWRDGYVELTFSGTWPEQPGIVTATLVGWIDEDSAKGRMKVEGRAEGRWTAPRKK